MYTSRARSFPRLALRATAQSGIVTEHHHGQRVPARAEMDAKQVYYTAYARTLLSATGFRRPPDALCARPPQIGPIPMSAICPLPPLSHG